MTIILGVTSATSSSIGYSPLKVSVALENVAVVNILTANAGVEINIVPFAYRSIQK